MLSDSAQDLLARKVLSLPYRPRISLVIAALDCENVRDTLPSIAAQIYSDIEIVLVAHPAQMERLTALSADFEKLRKAIVFATAPDSVGTVDAESIGLAAATGAFVAFMSPGDRLAPEALACAVCALNRHPKARAIYSDEDWIDASCSRLMPRFKTDWDPDAHLAFDLMGRLCLMRRDAVMKLGGLRTDRGPAAHYDLHSRIAAEASPSHIVHLPKVLYHRRIPRATGAKEQLKILAAYASAAREIAKEFVYSTEGAIVEIEAAPLAPHLNRVYWPLPDPAPLVSILVPTRDRVDLLRNCVSGVLDRTDYPAIELLILDNGSVETETFSIFEMLQLDQRVRILPIPGPFNYSKINNHGAAVARGQVLAFLNNDTEVIDRDWLWEMVSLAMRPEVGAVGAKLHYGDRSRVQHAGVVLAPGPLASHVDRLKSVYDPGYDGRLAGVRSYQAVTAACLVTRKAVFEEVDGFDEARLTIAYNDIDLCLRMCDRGYRIVCTPFARHVHLESVSRGHNQTAEQIARERSEQAVMQARWPDSFQFDPFHNPNTLQRWEEGLGLVAPRWD